MRNGKPFQTKWIQDKPISREEWENEPKTMKPDGTPLNISRNAVEGFGNGLTGVELATALLLGAAAVIAFRFRR
jgi:hypothetical protein